MVAPNESNPSAKHPASARKRRANQRNAQKSTGPRTPEGKARASRNATTHGIFCRDLLLKGENADLFVVTRDGFIEALKPQDAAQLALVDTAVAARWRMNRCQFAEAVLIERRIADATARVKSRFEALGRNMRYEDFSAAAINAQCERSEVFRRHYREWQTLRAAQHESLHPGHALAALMHGDRDGDQPLERLSRYEHRLEQSFHRCLRDLHVLKQKAKQYADEPPSPFRTQYGVADDEDASAQRGLGVPPERSSAATESSSEEELGRDAQATEHTHETPHVQNEPTAESSAASSGPADSSSAPTTPPDPAEMAALAKFTDLLSRCRAREEDQDDPEYDMT